MIAVSPSESVEISASNFTTIKSLSPYYKYSLYNKTKSKFMLENIGEEPVNILCVKEIEIRGNLIFIIDTNGGINECELYLTSSDFVNYAGIGLAASAVAGLSLALVYLVKPKK